MPDESPLAAEIRFRFPRGLPEVQTNTGHRPVQFQAAQTQIVGLTACILAHLLDPDVAPSLRLGRRRFERPGGSRAGLVQRAIVDVREQSRPAHAVFRHLEQPVTQSGLAVAAGMAQRVSGRQKPDAQVDSEPRTLVVVRVAIQGSAVSAEDVLQVAVGQIASFRTGDYNQAHLVAKEKKNK